MNKPVPASPAPITDAERKILCETGHVPARSRLEPVEGVSTTPKLVDPENGFYPCEHCDMTYDKHFGGICATPEGKWFKAKVSTPLPQQEESICQLCKQPKDNGWKHSDKLCEGPGLIVTAKTETDKAFESIFASLRIAKGAAELREKLIAPLLGQDEPKPMIYEPFSEDPPEGWPKEYVSLSDHRQALTSLAAVRDELSIATRGEEDRNWPNDYDALFSEAMEWKQRAELAEASLAAATERENDLKCSFGITSERERTALADAITRISKAIAPRMWLVDGRGCYEWDDDTYRKEFGWAMNEVLDAINPLRKIAGDWTTCPMKAVELEAARMDWMKRAMVAEASLAEAQTRISELTGERDSYGASLRALSDKELGR